MSGILVDPKTVTSEIGPNGQLGALVTTGYPSSGTSQSVLPVPPGLAPQGGTGFVPPPTKTLYVDGNRVDVYTPDGSILKPFLHIMDAVNQVVANGDNSASVAYQIWIAPGTYAESILLNNPALVNLIFTGWGATVDASIPGATGDGHNVAAINNDNLLSAVFVGLTFGNQSNLGRGADGHLYTFSSTTNGTNCLKGLNAIDVWGLQFQYCTFGNSGSADFFAQCVKGILFDQSYIVAMTVTLNNVNSVYTNYLWTGGAALGWSINYNNANPIPAGSTLTYVEFDYSNINASVNVGAGCRCVLLHGFLVANVTVGGTGAIFDNYQGSRITGTITINNGGTFRDRGGSHDQTPTVNAGGAWLQSITYGFGALVLGGAAPTVPAGSLGLGSGTSATATAGAATLPANPLGFLIANVGGTAVKIPYYNT